MCLNRQWVKNRYTGQLIYVSCGKCPACQQQKADARAKRIRANYPEIADGTCALMFTLTYANEFIPYVRISDIVAYKKHISKYCDETPRHMNLTNSTRWSGIDVPIYRMCNVRRCRYSGNVWKDKIYQGTDGLDNDSFLVDTFSNDDVTHFFDTYNLPKLRNCKHDWIGDRVGICYYPDVQNFFKRLRMNLKRKYGFQNNFTYYACSEYGGKYSRPHFHVLLFTKKEFYPLFERAINEAWPYDYHVPQRKRIEIARNAAAYVASYVNRSNVVPLLFQGSKNDQKHSYSQGFGLRKKCFTLDALFSSFLKRDFTFITEHVFKSGCSSTVSVVPTYILNRYAVKIKGYTRLDANALYTIYENPKRLNVFARYLDYDCEQLYATKTRIKNQQSVFLEHGLSVADYAAFASQCYSIRSSNSFKLSQETCSNPFYYYNNITDYYSGEIDCPTLDNLMPNNKSPISNPCKFPVDYALHEYYTRKYYNFSKRKEINNIVYDSY